MNNFGVRELARAYNCAKSFARALSISAIVLATLFSAFGYADNASDAAKDPAYLQMKRLVGGVWHTKVGNTTAESRWTYGPDGVTLIGETIVGPDSKTPFHMNARFGWDPKTKQMYYLDAHGLDTVYFGHGKVDGNDVVLSFKGLVGDPGSYIFRTNYTSEDSYHAVLYDDVNGKQGKAEETFDWVRSKD